MVAFTKSDTDVTTWMGADIVNSTSNTRDENGVKAQQRYTPFGEVRIDGNLATDHTYTGQVNDETTGLAFYNARYYDPATARFITPDSIVPNPNDGQDYNRYSYVRNNPVRFGDPSGNMPCEYCNGVQQGEFENGVRRADGRVINPHVDGAGPGGNSLRGGVARSSSSSSDGVTGNMRSSGTVSTYVSTGGFNTSASSNSVSNSNFSFSGQGDGSGEFDLLGAIGDGASLIVENSGQILEVVALTITVSGAIVCVAASAGLCGAFVFGGFVARAGSRFANGDENALRVTIVDGVITAATFGVGAGFAAASRHAASSAATTAANSARGGFNATSTAFAQQSATAVRSVDYAGRVIINTAGLACTAAAAEC